MCPAIAGSVFINSNSPLATGTGFKNIVPDGTTNKKSADSILACFIIVFILSEAIIELEVLSSITSFAKVSPVVFVQ